MPQIEAVCPNGHRFPSGIEMGPGSSAELRGNMSGPCPQCGQMGRIPNGDYEDGVRCN